MTLSYHVGSFQSIAGTGNQSITGVGFQPKALIIWTHELNSQNTFSGDAVFDIGLAGSTSSERYASFYNFDAAGSADCTEQRDTSDIISFDFNIDGTLDSTANLTTLGVDGFTLNWTANTAGSTRFHYIALGGDDLVNANTGQFNSPSSTGDVAYTGVGFQPDFVMFVGSNMTSDNVAVSDTGSMSIGFMNSAGEQAVSAVIAEDAVATMETARYQRTDKCLAIFTKNNKASLSHEATFVSMDVDGFTINYSTASTANKRVMYIALKGPNIKISSFTSPTAGTAPVAQATTGVGFEPRGVLFLTVGNTASASIADHLRICMGSASASTEEADVWTGDENGAASSACVCRYDTVSCIRVSDENASAGSTTTQALADFTSLDSDGFTLNWSVKDGSNAYEIIYVAFGDTPAAPAVGQDRSRISTPMMLADAITTTQAKKRYISTSL